MNEFPVRKYVRRSREVEGIVWTGKNTSDIQEWIASVTGIDVYEVGQSMHNEQLKGMFYVPERYGGMTGRSFCAYVWAEAIRSWIRCYEGDLVVISDGKFGVMASRKLRTGYDLKKV